MSEQAPATGIEIVNELHEQAVQTTIEAENQRIAEQAAAQAQLHREQQEARVKSWVEPGNARSKDSFDATQNHLQKLDQWQVRKDKLAAKRSTGNIDQGAAHTSVGVVDAYLSSNDAGKVSAASHDRYVASLKQQETHDDKYGKMGLKELAQAQAQAELDANRTTKEDIQPYLDARLATLIKNNEANASKRQGKQASELDGKGDVSSREIWEARIAKLKADYKEGKEQKDEPKGFVPEHFTRRDSLNNGGDSKPTDSTKATAFDNTLEDSDSAPVSGQPDKIPAVEAVKTGEAEEVTPKVTDKPQAVEQTTSDEAKPADRQSDEVSADEPDDDPDGPGNGDNKSDKPETKPKKQHKGILGRIRNAFTYDPRDTDPSFDATYGASVESMRKTGLSEDVIDEVLARRKSQYEASHPEKASNVIQLRPRNAQGAQKVQEQDADADASLDDLLQEVDQDGKRLSRVRSMGRTVLGLTARERDLEAERQRVQAAEYIRRQQEREENEKRVA